MANDLTPKKKYVPPTFPEEDGVDEETKQYLRANRIVDAINSQLPQGSTVLTPIPGDYVFKKRNRETVSVALHAAFELIGGVPALVQWAGSNPEKFFGLWSKLLPTDTETPAGGVTINVTSAIPKNELDRVSIDETGKVIELDEELPE